jgi:hypothetical protein
MNPVAINLYFIGSNNQIMKILFFFLLSASIFMVTGCVSPAAPTGVPIGKGSLDLCVSDPSQADYWQKTSDVLWSIPGDSGEKNRTVIAQIPACDNSSATIWENTPDGETKWDRVTIHTSDGRVYDGWLPSGHIAGITNETGTEWSKNYSSIVGRWDQTGRGNAPEIWFEFTADGMYTYNYDMMGNKENIQDRGSWVYLGNMTYDLISNIRSDHRHMPVVIDHEGKSFIFGAEYRAGSSAGIDKIFARG